MEIAKDKEAKKVLSFSRKGYSFQEKDSGDFLTMTLMDDFYLNTVAIDYGTINGHPYIKIVADYDWINMPTFRLHDGFVITWSEGWYGRSWRFTESQKECSYFDQTSGCTSYTWDSTTHYNP
ncbi:hypothetical protein RZN22_19015 [Bacillaceae bacterium S4-13-58]